MKLASELSRKATGHTLYILDEPTTGLHFHDVAKLLEVLFKLRASGNTLSWKPPLESKLTFAIRTTQAYLAISLSMV